MLPVEDAGRALPFRSSPMVGLGQEGGDAEKGPQNPQEWSGGRREHCGCEPEWRLLTPSCQVLTHLRGWLGGRSHGELRERPPVWLEGVRAGALGGSSQNETKGETGAVALPSH